MHQSAESSIPLKQLKSGKRGTAKSAESERLFGNGKGEIVKTPPLNLPLSGRRTAYCMWEKSPPWAGEVGVNAKNLSHEGAKYICYVQKYIEILNDIFKHQRRLFNVSQFY